MLEAGGTGQGMLTGHLVTEDMTRFTLSNFLVSILY